MRELGLRGASCGKGSGNSAEIAAHYAKCI